MNYGLNPPLNEQEKTVMDELRSRINVANEIASARFRLELTQKELGERAGTKQSRISEIESLRGNVRFDTLDRIARALGLMITLVPRIETIAKATTEVVGRPYLGLQITGSGDSFAVCLPPEWSRASIYEPVG